MFFVVGMNDVVLVCQAQRYSASSTEEGLFVEKGMDGTRHPFVPLVQHFVGRRLAPQGTDHLREKAMLIILMVGEIMGTTWIET